MRMLLLSFLLIFGCHKGGGSSSHTFYNVDGDFILGARVKRIAHTFYEHVFSGDKGRPRVLLFSHWDEEFPANFDGIYVFLDGESTGPKGKHKKFLKRMLYIGSRTDTGAKASIYMPFASLHFAERESFTPLDLYKRRSLRDKPYFAAYLASNCVDFRERIYDQLVELSRENFLGEVHALGECAGNYSETKRKPSKFLERESVNFLDAAVEMLEDYQFVLSSENVIVDGYVTEKPINGLLAGAIPIYVGSDAIFKKNILNPKSFIFVRDAKTFKEIVLETVSDKNKIKKMQQAIPLVSDQQLYLYSWHKDVAETLKNHGYKTFLDDIRFVIRNMSL